MYATYIDCTDVKDPNFEMLRSVLENHYIQGRKPVVDQLQEIEQQAELFKSNDLVVVSLKLLKERADYRLQELENSYNRMQAQLEHYSKSIFALANAKLD
jgi:hypothetical protein